MARKYQIITELYHRTVSSITAPQEWKRFLTTACRNYRLPFDEQVLLFAQRPDAIAVLPIEGRNGWNERFGRWVNRGATGIAVFDGDAVGRSRLKYYFDISDTHESRFARPVPLWSMEPGFEETVIEALENSFGELEYKVSLADALLSAATNAVEDNMPDYLAELKYYKENSFLEELDDLNLEVIYRTALKNSVGYMLLARCGIDPLEYFTDDDFRGITDFSTQQTINALGVATGDIGQMCLSVISRTVMPLQRQAAGKNRTFADGDKIQYPVNRTETTTPERSDKYEQSTVHDAGRLQSPEPPASAGAGDSPWEIRIAAPEVPQTAPQSDLHESADRGQAEHSSDGDRADSASSIRENGSTDGENRGADGADESGRSSALDGTDEQYPSGSGRNDPERTDIQLNDEPDEVPDEADTVGSPERQVPFGDRRSKEAEREIESETDSVASGADFATTQLPAFLDEKLIMVIIANKDDDLKFKKQQIEMFFSVHLDSGERADYLKSAYQDRYTELLVDGVRIGYKPMEDGLLMWEGSYLSRTSESVFSWDIVVDWTAQLIDKKKYFINTKITPPKNHDTQQLSLFDFASFDSPAEPMEQLSFIPRPQLSQQIIDEALCIGANDRNSRLIICAYFMKDHQPEKNAAFLKAHYRTNGAGFYVNGRPYAIWYNEDGIRIASGESAQGRNATLLTWEQAATRIRELQDLGRYMPQSELERVTDYEVSTLGSQIVLTARDMTEEAREAGYLPVTRLVLSEKGGYPELEKRMAELLSDPEMLKRVADEWDTFAQAHAENSNLLRFRFYRTQEIREKLQDLQREPVVFTASEDYNPNRKFYISSDEIDKILRGNQDYRLSVYSFFAMHPDSKEREKCLKAQHGEYSGSYSGNDNLLYTAGKGISFSHGSIGEPYAKVELKWNQVTKRVTAMINANRFLTDEDRAAMPDYEMKQLARAVHGFFYNAPDEFPRPYSQNPIGNFWEGVQEVQEQLSDPARVHEIYQTMMLPLWESTAQDDRFYTSRKAELEAMQAYIAGTYSVFGLDGPLRPLGAVEATPNQEPVIEDAEEVEVSYHDLAVEFLRFYQEFDPYGYRDDMGVGQSDAEIVEELARRLENPDQRSTLIELLQTFMDDTDPDEEIAIDLTLFMERLQELPEKVIPEVVESNQADEYRLLDRLRSDCEYFLGNGERAEKHLWAGNVEQQIAKMREQYAVLREKPEWLTEQDIDRYEMEMTAAPDTLRPYAVGDKFTIAGDGGSSEFIITEINGDDLFYVFSDLPEQAPTFIRREEFERNLETGNINPVVQEEPAEKETALAPPKRRREQVVFSTLHPEIPADQRHSFHITDNELGHGTRSEKYAANVAAIRTLKQIEAEDRLATPEEQEILSRYVGWGGLADCFDERHGKYLELKSLLDEDEYAAARASTLTAFYTSPVIIRAMYQALSNMGLREGNLLEPSCGVGNFIGMLPMELAGCKAYGVELDSISGRIAQQLYQNSSIAVTGFEKVQMPDSFFDAAIGNVPFGDFKLRDRRYDKNHWLIHDYFFGKALDKVRPGGVVAFITSKGTLDKENSAVRKYLAQRADLIGAIRLPNNAFKDNAGTEVTSDIIFLQKRDRITDIEPDWVHLDTDENGIRMNSYFVQHPEMVLGEMVMESTRFGMDSTCRAYEDSDLSELLSEAVQNLHAEITAYDREELDEGEDHAIPADPSVRNFSYTIHEGQVYYRENSVMYPVEVSVTAENRIRGMIALRDQVRKVIEYQTENYEDWYIQKEQEKLNTLYDQFEAKYGRINSRGNSLAFSEDSGYYLLCSLEVLDNEGNFQRKADMFTKRTIRSHEVITSVDTASEALAVSISEKACVDMEYMVQRTGKTAEELETELSGVIFRDVRCAEKTEELSPAHTDLARYPFVTADEYLSGHVRRKLRMAKALYEVLPAEKKAAVAPNIKALEAVQPVDLTAAEIGVRIGANWVPVEIYQQFMYELLGTNYYARSRIHILRSAATGQWSITEKTADRTNVKTFTTYGTKRMSAYHILEQTLNQKDVRVFDYIEDEHGNRKPVLNKKETAIAQDRQELIKQKFSEWIWKDIDRREQLCRIYNETFNSIRPREYDGSHIRFSGMNPEITLRTHQINAIAHIMYGGNTLLAHEVGAGKTFEMVAAAMEMKRLGLCSKSLIVVPNHIVGQWASEWLQLYPSANLLVATKKDFEARNRKKLCARIATGDYDAIIIGHSQFEKIPISAERQVAILQQQIDEIMYSIEEAKSAKAERYTVKQLERTRKSLETRLEKLNDRSRKDDIVSFEELGVDRIFIDESHYFKNLFLATKMRNVGGIAQTEAQKSSDLFMKCRYLDELTVGRGSIFATGTPISNSMVELYTIQRYLQYGLLEEMGLIHFDDWASDFGETITAIELSPEGYTLIGR